MAGIHVLQKLQIKVGGVLKTSRSLVWFNLFFLKTSSSWCKQGPKFADFEFFYIFLAKKEVKNRHFLDVFTVVSSFSGVPDPCLSRGEFQITLKPFRKLPRAEFKILDIYKTELG